jgi:flagellar motility protein MotE (MotC chaperone)
MSQRGGYDQFFKQAQKASGLSKAPTHSVRSAQKAGQKAAVKKSGRVETPEDRIRAELALRMKKKKSSARRPKAKFPVFAALVACFALVAAAVGFFKADVVEEYAGHYLSKFEIGFFGNAEASDKPAGKKEEKHAAQKAAQEPAHEAAHEAAHNPAKHAEGGAKEKWSNEEVSFFSKLNDRKKELDLKESELAKLEEELLKRKQELDEKLKQLETMRAEISKTLKTRVASDHEKVDKLVAVYSTMKPAQASKIIETLDEDLAVEILDNMKKKSAAEILNMMDAKKARKLSEMLTGYERSTASTKDVEKEKEE